MSDIRRPSDVFDILRPKYQANRRAWFRGEGVWPLSIPLGQPTQEEVLSHIDAIQHWIKDWDAYSGCGDLSWEERHWSKFGKHRVPRHIRFTSPTDVAKYLGLFAEWALAERRACEIQTRFPWITDSARLHFGIYTDYSETDWTRMLSVIAWLKSHPGANVFARQLPIPGVDSKWVERNIPSLTDLMAPVTPAGYPSFHAAWGIRTPSKFTQIVVLDAKLRAQISGVRDLALSNDQAPSLTWRPYNVLVLENKQTGLALPDIPDTVAIIGLGYAVGVLRNYPWVTQAKAQVYWGDLDTHGFAILSMARRALPEVQSVLMTRADIDAHRDLVCAEDDGKGSPILGMLTTEERAAFSAIKVGDYGSNARLEQERIGWRYALERLSCLLPVPLS